MRRYIFCGTFRRTLRPPRPLAGTVPYGDRTFLPRFRGRLLVGVEPTSENGTGQEPTYLVQFTQRELPRQIRVLRLERTRNATC